MTSRELPDRLSDQEPELEDPREAMADLEASRSWLGRLFRRGDDTTDDTTAGEDEPPVTGVPEEPPVTGYPADTDEDATDTAQESESDDDGTDTAEETDEDGTDTAESDEGGTETGASTGDSTEDGTGTSSANIAEGGDDTSGTETGSAIPVDDDQSTIVSSGDGQGSDISTGDATATPVEDDSEGTGQGTDDDAFARPVGRIGKVFDRTDDGLGIGTSELEEQARLIRDTTRPQLAPEVIEARLGGVDDPPGPSGPDESPDLAFGTGASADNVHEVALGPTADLVGPTDLALEPPLDPVNVLTPTDEPPQLLDDSGAVDETPQGGTDTVAGPDDDPDP
jgi:hypothetical protein